MKIALIVAVSENGVIGENNDLIWHLPNDIKFFKEKTLNHHVIMGRKNFESIPHKFRPLANRTNIIVTRNKNYSADNCLVTNSLREAINLAKKNNEEEAFVIGGGEIYKLALEEDLVDRIYLTRIHHEFDGDTFFPYIDEKWIETHRSEYKKDEKHKYDFTFLTYEKEN